MSQAAAKAAAQIYLQLQDNINYKNTFADSVEPYRAVIDLSRTMYQHSIRDGSKEYVKLVDLLETLVCA